MENGWKSVAIVPLIVSGDPEVPMLNAGVAPPSDPANAIEPFRVTADPLIESAQLFPNSVPVVLAHGAAQPMVEVEGP